MTRDIASSDDIFAVCATSYDYPEPIARVLSHTLYWSQHPKHELAGQLGIYKTDAELAKELHKHPKTIGRLLRQVCSPVGSDKPRPVFHTRYAPMPSQYSGRVRWLFRTP